MEGRLKVIGRDFSFGARPNASKGISVELLRDADEQLVGTGGADQAGSARQAVRGLLGNIDRG